jgi:antitoxin ParD1/3/4
MNVSLTPHLEEYVRNKVESGLYNSSSEVVREALRLMEERDRVREIRLEELRKEIQVGIDQIERGQYTEYTTETLHELFAEVRSRGKKMLEAERRKGV